MTEPEPPDRARVVALEYRLFLFDEPRVEIVLLVLRLRVALGGDGDDVAVAVPFSVSCAWLDAISSVNIPASASTWWRRRSVPLRVVGVSDASTRSRPSISP